MKKVLLVFLLTLFCIPNTFALSNEYIINKKNVKITKEEYEKFEKMGYTNDVIENMDQELYNSIKDFNYFDSKSKSEYYKEYYIYSNKQSMESSEEPVKIITSRLSEEEFNSAEKEFGFVWQLKNNYNGNLRDLLDLSDMNYYETTYKKITIVISRTSIISDERHVAVGLTWKIMPSVRSYDILAMRSSNGFFTQNSEYGSYTYTFAPNSDCNVTVPTTYQNTFNYGNTAWNNKNTGGIGNYYGIGFTHKLQNTIIGCYNDLGVPQYQTVSAMSSFMSSTASAGGNQLSVNASYQHATSSVNYNNVVHSYNYSSSGLGGVIYFSNGMSSYYDGMGGVSLTF